MLVTPSRVHASDQGAKCFSLDSSVALVMCSYEGGEKEGGEREGRGRGEGGRREGGEREGRERGEGGEREGRGKGEEGGGNNYHIPTIKSVQESSTLAMLDRMVPK